MFFPERGESTADAKGVCAICPVQASCLDHAMATRERFGIWGGTSERERRRLRSAAVVSADVA
jgi:WhiB family redox-sensing transcriptional regulator